MSYEMICAQIKATGKDYLNKTEVANLCHLSKKTIYKLEKTGKLPYEICNDHHTHKIKTVDVLAMLQERYCKQGQDSLYVRRMKNYYSDQLLREQDVLKINDIIRLTGFSKSSVINWISQGKLKSFRIGKFYKIPKHYLVDFLLSPAYRTIKNKSDKQKADNDDIEKRCSIAILGGCDNE